MDNTATIQANAISVDMQAAIHISDALKVILILIFVMATILFGCFVYWIGDGNPKSYILPVLILGYTLFRLGRSFAWNIFGTEDISVTSKSINFTRNYGLFKIANQTIVFQDCTTKVKINDEYKGQEYAFLEFYDIHPQTLEPVVKFTSTIKLPVEIIMEWEAQLQRVL